MIKIFIGSFVVAFVVFIAFGFSLYTAKKRATSCGCGKISGCCSGGVVEEQDIVKECTKSCASGVK